MMDMFGAVPALGFLGPKSREASTGGDNKQNHVPGNPQKRNITSVVTPKKGNYFLIKAIEPHL